MEPRLAFVTGGASGLGRSIAGRLASDGFHVVIADISDEDSAMVVEEIQSAGGGGEWVHCDVGDIDSVRVAAEQVTGTHGGVDLLVNNAGFDIPGFFLESDPRDWDSIVKVVMMGTLNCTFVLAPSIVERCRARGYGRIVNIASDAGRVGSMGEAAYSAAKGGVIAFSKSMARELARDRVTVNAVCPGPAETPMTDRIRQAPLGAKLMTQMEQVTPLKRLAAPAEVAAIVSYFASDDAAFTTGQTVSISGGLSMHG